MDCVLTISYRSSRWNIERILFGPISRPSIYIHNIHANVKNTAVNFYTSLHIVPPISLLQT